MLLIHVVSRCFVLFRNRPRPAARPRNFSHHQSRFRRPMNSTTAAAAASCPCLSCWAWASLDVVACCTAAARCSCCSRRRRVRRRLFLYARSDAYEMRLFDSARLLGTLGAAAFGSLCRQAAEQCLREGKPRTRAEQLHRCVRRNCRIIYSARDPTTCGRETLKPLP